MNIWEGDNPSIYIVLPNFTIIIESDRDIGFLISYSDIDMEFIINGNSNKLKMRWDIYMNSYLLESDSNNGLSFQAKITDIQANIIYNDYIKNFITQKDSVKKITNNPKEYIILFPTD